MKIFKMTFEDDHELLIVAQDLKRVGEVYDEFKNLDIIKGKVTILKNRGDDDELFDKEKNRIIELEDALRKLRGIEAWISDEKMKKHFQDTVYKLI